MLTDKQQKKEFKATASAEPEKYYPVEKLISEGFIRKQCTICGMFFWTVNEDRTVCGDPACSGGFDVVTNNPAKNRLSYEDVWNKIVEMFEPRGYKPLKRYPVVSRWNPTTPYTMASIAAFQPYVITGEAEPPAKMLIIPQFCLRFGDIDNVGITGSHCTGFVMIGQHAFLSREEWDQERFFTDIYEFLTADEGVGLDKSEITIHEDAWAGGGSFGPCLEFFSRGVELFNQVYTMFEQTPEGNKELRLKVLDMGLGMERIAWFSQATPNLYEATFPYVLDKIREITNVEPDFDLYKQFSRYSAYLNVDEVDNILDAWGRVAAEMDVELDVLREKIMPMAAIYSIAEHARALLVAINDGGLPSNTGGGYNLRVILRRALGFIDEYGWNLDLGEIAEWHAEELKNLFPELKDGIENVKKILAFEKHKFEETKENVKRIIAKILAEGEDITIERLLELYDSQGISPELVKKEASLAGRKVDVPDDFYKQVGELHEKREQIYATQRQADIDLSGIPDTIPLYFEDYATLECEAEVLKVEGVYVVLDRTVAYPTSGGQLHDIGTINDQEFVDVFKDGSIIIHQMAAEPSFAAGETVTVKVNPDVRKQLSQHHTATHVVNAAARAILGSHVNQAGAKKSLEKAHLDITHYDSLTKDIEDQIEAEANRIVQADIPITTEFKSRTRAEQEHGMAIYQGGAVPGKNIRIVEIGDGIDVEACGGTHLHSTGEIGKIKILKSTKIQDGIVRIEFTAGAAAEQAAGKEESLLNEAASIFGVDPSQVPARAAEIFAKWKRLKKLVGTGKEIPEELLSLVSSEEEQGDALQKTAEIFNTQPEHVPKNAEKFLRQYNDLVEQAKAAPPPAEE
jgi:alanyl-tRNA synthetase